MGMGNRIDAAGQRAADEARQTQEKPAAADSPLLAERCNWSEEDILNNKDKYIANGWNIIIYKGGKSDELHSTHKESYLLKARNTGIFGKAVKVARAIAGSAADSQFGVIIYSSGKRECDITIKKYCAGAPFRTQVNIQYDLRSEAVQKLFSDAKLQRVTEADIISHVYVQLNEDLEGIVTQMAEQDLKKSITSKSIVWAKNIFSKTYTFYGLDVIALQDKSSVYPFPAKVLAPKEYGLKDIYRKIDKGDFDEALAVVEDLQKAPDIESNERQEASGVIKAFIALSQGLLDEFEVDKISSYGSISHKYIQAITIYRETLSEAKKALLGNNLAKALNLYSSVASGIINKTDFGVGGMTFAENRKELIEAAQAVADKAAVVSEKNNEDLNKKIEFLSGQDQSKEEDLAVIKKIAVGAQKIREARNFESAGDFAKAVESYTSAISLHINNVDEGHLAALNDANRAIYFLSTKNLTDAVESVKIAYNKIKSDNMRFLKGGLEGLIDVKNNVVKGNIKQAMKDCEAVTEKLKDMKNIPDWVLMQQTQLSDTVRFGELLETDLQAAKELLERMKDFDVFSGTKIISDYKKAISELESAIDFLNDGSFSIALNHITEALSKAKNSVKINNIKGGLEHLVAAQASEEKDDVTAAIDLYYSAIAKLKVIPEVSKIYKAIEERRDALESISKIDEYIQFGNLSGADADLRKASVASLDGRILKPRRDLMQLIGQAREALSRKDKDAAKDFLQMANNKRKTSYVSKILDALDEIDEAKLKVSAGKYDDAWQIYYALRASSDVGAIAKDGMSEISQLKKQAAEQEKNKDTEKWKNEINREREKTEREREEKERALSEKQTNERAHERALRETQEKLEREREDRERAERKAEELRKQVTAPFVQKPEPQPHHEPVREHATPQNGFGAVPRPAEMPAPRLSGELAGVVSEAIGEPNNLKSYTSQGVPNPVGGPEVPGQRRAERGYDLVVGKGQGLEERASESVLSSEVGQHQDVSAENLTTLQIEELLFIGKYKAVLQLADRFREQVSKDKELRELFSLALAGNCADDALMLGAKVQEMRFNAAEYEENAVVAKIQGRVKDAKAKIAASDRTRSEAERINRERVEKINNARKLVDKLHNTRLTGRRAQIFNNIKSMMTGDE